LVLVVEKDPYLAEMERYFLERQGFVVEFCENGFQAVERVRQIHPDLLITEILVPGLDGIEVCRRIKSNAETAGTLVLIVSILLARERCLEAGADDFLLKPLEEAKLLARVKNLLGLEVGA